LENEKCTFAPGIGKSKTIHVKLESGNMRRNESPTSSKKRGSEINNSNKDISMSLRKGSDQFFNDLAYVGIKNYKAQKLEQLKIA
jgi:hypothetical protein